MRQSLPSARTSLRILSILIIDVALSGCTSVKLEPAKPLNSANLCSLHKTELQEKTAYAFLSLEVYVYPDWSILARNYPHPTPPSLFSSPDPPELPVPVAQRGVATEIKIKFCPDCDADLRQAYEKLKKAKK